MTLAESQADTIASGPPAYERYFVPAIGRPVAEDLIAAADLKPGEHVLDVACGTGIVARLAAAKVGPSGAVSGLDIHPGMISEARQVCADQPQFSWHVADAQSLPLPEESFDVVLCQMGLQFMPGKLAALREMRRVLKPGGRLLVNVPGPMPDLFAVLTDALTRHVGDETAKFGHAVFAMHDRDEMVELLRSAGFSDSAVNQQPKSLHLPPPVDFLWQYIHSTPLAAGVFGRARPDARTALEKDVRAGWRDFETKGGMDLDVGITTACARR